MPTKLLPITFLIFFAANLQAQLMNHYWVHNFNSTSSLLGGAVVAGDGDNTAIFYNPATISQMQKGSSVSLAANLFTWNFYNLSNALGDGIDLNTNNFLVQPQFISFTYKPKNTKGIRLAFAALTRVKEKMEMSYSDATYVDVLKRYPGDEKYNTTFNYRNDYSDSWVGVAIAQQVNDRFSYGVSMFASFSSLIYANEWAAYAYNPSDHVNIGGFRLSEGSYSESLRFTDYRLIFKLGVAYEISRWKFGLTVTTPTMRLFSSGKSATRIYKQSNIAYEGNLLPDFIIFDGQSNKELKTNYKLPGSVAFGFIFDIPNRGSKFYFTAEYFARIKSYKMVDAQITPDISSPGLDPLLGNADWLSYGYASKPIINLVFGYSWTLKKDLTFLNAVRTDFSSIHNVNNYENNNLNHIKTTDYNIYHYSGGVKFSVKKQRFIAGGDFAFGYRLNASQVVNFTNPVEYNPENGRALQGPISNTMNMYYFGFSIYVGATLNFSKNTALPEK